MVLLALLVMAGLLRITSYLAVRILPSWQYFERRGRALGAVFRPQSLSDWLNIWIAMLLGEGLLVLWLRTADFFWRLVYRLVSLFFGSLYKVVWGILLSYRVVFYVPSACRRIITGKGDHEKKKHSQKETVGKNNVGEEQQSPGEGVARKTTHQDKQPSGNTVSLRFSRYHRQPSGEVRRHSWP